MGRNQIRPHPVQQIERSPEKLCKMEDIYRQEGAEQSKAVILRPRAGCSLQGHFPLGRTGSAAQITQLMVIRQIPIDLFKISFLGELKLYLSLSLVM